jgi:hypothetical protein
MNTDSCDMRRVTGDIEEWLYGPTEPKPGEFMIRDSVVSKANPVLRPKDGEDAVTIKFFCAVLPGGHYCALPIRPVPDTVQPINGGHSWAWDGNEEKPTLTPSVNSIGNWHGWIRAGRMESC